MDGESAPAALAHVEADSAVGRLALKNTGAESYSDCLIKLDTGHEATLATFSAGSTQVFLTEHFRGPRLLRASDISLTRWFTLSCLDGNRTPQTSADAAK